MIRVLVCGDFRAADPSKITVEKDLASFINSVDLRICNFEAPVHVNGAKPIIKSGPALDQSSESPNILRKMGFNVILMANNHIMDYGELGLNATLNSFKTMITVGAGTAKEAFSIRYVEINAKKIGLLSLVQREFGSVESKEDESIGAAWIGSWDVPDIIMQAKKECDFLLVFPHAGVEHTVAPLPEWRRLYKSIIDFGADCIVASHPHCPQGWEIYKDKYIYYSLGDFYFDELTYDDMWYKSIALELIIEDEIKTITHYLCFDDKSGIITFDNSKRIHQYIKYANHLLEDEVEYESYINSMCTKHWPGIKYGLLRGVGGVALSLRLKYIIRLLGCILLGDKDEMFLLNALQCESHRWVAERYLKCNNNK